MRIDQLDQNPTVVQILAGDRILFGQISKDCPGYELDSDCVLLTFESFGRTLSVEVCVPIELWLELADRSDKRFPNRK